MDIIAITTIVSLAAIAAALFARLRSEQAAARRTARENERLLSEKEQCREALQEARTRSAEQQAAADRTLAAAQTEAARQLAEARAEADKLLAEARAEIRIWSERFETQTAERGKLEKQFTDYFQNLANDILEDKTKRFTETNRQNIGDLLRPLGENLEKFRQRIEQEAAERKVLEAEIRRLHETSNQVSREANNLAAALRGNSKAQGDWGEMILETLLESSGLQKGIHFRVQEDFRTEEGAHVRPDVVLLLPGDKQMVIDSKVSLTAYAAYAEADGADGIARKAALAAHVASVRKHIDELAGKSYQKLTSASPDFVIMFVPNEPAFLVALQSDPKLWDDAYRRKVILSSPTNLFAILKIVDDLWRRDNQDRYALEIARQGGALYDKFVGFAENFLAVGDALGRTDKAYRAALGQLREGNGNLVRRAESLRKLGVKAAKKMPAALAPLDDEETAEEADGNVLPDSSSSADGEAGNIDETGHGR
ncbi:DNA recombination protein RmuC [Rikenella microfusus]|uniref:DNA recombination protein RmuC n=1 Tax=Rikenella microfusus TaxID=28139 RepID=UPI00248E65A6|nr:DNA recombination protein RmuC [Rikenella microfusus]